MNVHVLVDRIKGLRDSLLEIAEIILAAIVFFGVVYFGIEYGWGFLSKDWSNVSVIYEFISFILIMLLGFEVTRLILVHSITVVMELMLLVIARKMLQPDIAAIDLLFCVAAFCLTIGTYYLYEIKPIKSLMDLTK